MAPKAVGRLVALAGAGGLGPAAAAQLFIDFEPPLYAGSAAGEPLAGQDGWYTPGGAGEWLVYTYDDNPLRLPGPWSWDEQFAGAVAPPSSPAMIERKIEPEGILSAVIAVGFEGRPPAEGEIGRISLEPLGESAGIALVPQWNDPSGETWRAAMLVFDSIGTSRLVDPGFDALDSRRWYSWGVEVRGDIVLDVWLRDVATGRAQSLKPVDWYVGRGPQPDALRLTAGSTTSSPGSVVAIDGLSIDAPYSCYADCDHSGQLDFFEFLCFQEAFVAGAPYADCDASGQLDYFDFLCFQNEFSGCP